jgi:ABC-type multidrug transport system fused ATPase/permease subunit
MSQQTLALTEPISPRDSDSQSLRDLARRFVPYLRPNLGRLSIAIGTAALFAALGIFQMYIVMMAISYVVVGNAQAIGAAALALVGLACVEAILRIVNAAVITRLNQKMTVTIRHDLISRLHRAELSHHVNQNSGEWISKALFEADRFRDFLTGNLMQFAHSILWFAGVTFFLLAINPGVTGPLIVALPLMAFIAFRWVRRLRAHWQAQREAWDHHVGFLTQRLDGVADIRAFGQEEAVLRELDEVAENYRKVHTGLSIRRLGLASYLEFCVFIALAMLIFFGGVQLLEHGNLGSGLFFQIATGMMPAQWMLLGTNSMMASMGMAQGAALAAGTLAAFVLFAKRMLNPIRDVAHQLGEFSDVKVSAQRILDILDLPEESADGTELASIRGEVEFDHVSFGYRPGTNVLHDVDLSVRPGEHVAIVGQTGAGKSTLMQLLVRFYAPTAGRVRIDGDDLGGVSLESLRSQVVIVPQEALLFDGTILDNIRFGRPDATDDEITQAARDIGADQVFAALPRGYQTKVGERGRKLSVGERQLIALTRAMLADPRIVVLDEAISSVDPERQREVHAAARRLLAGRTAFIVAHWLELVEDADRVIVMDDGRIVESGTPGELIARPGGRLARLWHTQANTQNGQTEGEA